MDTLKPYHAQLVYEHWAYKLDTTVDNIARDIEQLPTAGVFLRENNQLVTWMMNHPSLGMSRLYTAEDHRRRGYASLVLQYLAIKMVKAGYMPISNVVVGNVPSRAMFKHTFGFKHVGNIVYLGIRPKNEKLN